MFSVKLQLGFYVKIFVLVFFLRTMGATKGIYETFEKYFLRKTRINFMVTDFINFVFKNGEMAR